MAELIPKMNLNPRIWLLVVLALCTQGCVHPKINTASTPDAVVSEDADHFVECHNGVVVSVSGLASDAGLSMLKRGGNAVDAAVATAFALTVAYPPSAGMGGGGFMLVHPAHGKGEPVVFDYRERAPAAAFPKMYSKEETQFSQRAVAVPGTVRGFATAHQRFGTLPWRELLQPAIALARDGFVLDTSLADSINLTLGLATNGYGEFHRVFDKPGGGLWHAGDRLIQPDLARTLQLLADGGPEVFYKGTIADEIVAEMARGKGLITAEDLANYSAIERKPLSTRYHGYDVIVPPPPSSGGTCLLEELNELETFDLKSWGRWSPKTVHVMAEAMRRASYDRARFLGDPAFVKIPTKLATHGYGHQLAKTIDLNKATHSADLSADIPLSKEGESTTQFSIIDRNGMAVANTFTLERRWGSRIVVKDMGFLLNNDMRAFNLFPGITDTNGIIGTAPNLIAPGKRPISSMTPTFVTKNGRVVLVTGSPGSRAIPHTVLCVLVNIFDFGMPIQDAVETPRFTQEWFPDQIGFEHPELYPALVKALNELGHKIVPPGPLPFQGDAHTILVTAPHRYIGVADHRINGKASGY